MRPGNQVFLIATHQLDDRVLKMYRDIRSSMSGFGETVILYHSNDLKYLEIADYKMHIFSDDILVDLKYQAIKDTLVPGSNHFSLLDYYLKNLSYTYYWYIEYDVAFNGKWDTFFKEFSEIEADFITSQIEIYKNRPLWYWWNTLQHPHKAIAPDDRICSFNPLYRISSRALSYINEALLSGWRGHHEVLLPSLLSQGGFSIMDFGGRGRFVPPRFYNKFYSWATFRWRPVFEKAGLLHNKLYHPVK